MPVFERILCAVNPANGGSAALRKARLLAGSAGEIQIFDLEGDTDLAALATAAAEHDLLVVAANGQPRVPGLDSGSAISRVLQSAGVPVLVARPLAAVTFPGKILVGSAGDRDDETVRVAARVAAQHHAPVIIAHAGPRADPSVGHALTRQSTIARAAVGSAPAVLCVSGDPVTRLSSMAATTAAGLLVVGGSGAAAGVSQRIAHEAPCSVLVVGG